MVWVFGGVCGGDEGEGGEGCSSWVLRLMGLMGCCRDGLLDGVCGVGMRCETFMHDWSEYEYTPCP